MTELRLCASAPASLTAGMEVTHVQGGNRKIKLSQPQQMMAQERQIVDEAYAGDIIGVFDPGIFSIGDTLHHGEATFEFEGIPTFAPEHFARVRQVDTMKRKQFMKGISQIAQEGAIQIFQEYNTGMEEIIVGVVGVLQFDVLKYRLENEYNVEIRMDTLPYEHIRWIENEDIDMDKLVGTSDMKKIQDLKGRPLLLFVNAWSVGMVLDRNEGLVLWSSAGNRACVRAAAGRKQCRRNAQKGSRIWQLLRLQMKILRTRCWRQRCRSFWISGQSGADRVKCSRRYLRRCPRSLPER